MGGWGGVSGGEGGGMVYHNQTFWQLGDSPSERERRKRRAS